MHREQKPHIFLLCQRPLYFKPDLSVRICVFLHKVARSGTFRASLNINSTFRVSLKALFSLRKMGLAPKFMPGENFERRIVLSVRALVSPTQKGPWSPGGPTCDSLSSIIPACSPSKLLTRNLPGLVSLSLCAETCLFFSLKAFVTAACKVTDTAVLALLSWTIVPPRLVSCLLQRMESTRPHVFKTMHAAPTDGVGSVLPPKEDTPTCGSHPVSARRNDSSGPCFWWPHASEMPEVIFRAPAGFWSGLAEFR